MDSKFLDTSHLIAYRKGTLPEEDRILVEQALRRSPELRAEMDLISAMLDQSQLPEPGEAYWSAMESYVMSAWDAERENPRTRSSRWGLSRLATATGLLIALLALGVFLYPKVLSLPGDKAKNDNNISVNLTPEASFDDGVAMPRGKAEDLRVLRAAGEHYVFVHSIARHKVQGADEVSTVKGVVELEYAERARITLLPNTTVRFHEIGTTVVPYLVHGAITFETDTRHLGKSLLILAEKTHIVDIGTRFIVRADLDHNGSVDVLEGEVRVDRPGVEPAAIHAGEHARWSASQRGVVMGEGLSGSDAFKDAAAMLDAETAAKMARPHNEHRNAGSDGEEPKAKDNPAEPDGPAVTQVSSSPWQNVLDSMPLIKRDAVVKFYNVVESQMKTGYTMRAIANLENFVSEHPGPESEKARFLLGECHYNLEQYDEALKSHLDYITRFPEGTWNEMAKARFVEIKKMKKK